MTALQAQYGSTLPVKPNGTFTTATTTAVTGISNVTFNPKSGSSFNFTLGYRFTPNFRSELEFSYLSGDVDANYTAALATTVSVSNVIATGQTLNPPIFLYDTKGNLIPNNTASAVAATGKFDNCTVFVNSYYDFKNNSSITPFLGAGLGFSSLAASSFADANGTLLLNGFSSGLAHPLTPPQIVRFLWPIVTSRLPQSMFQFLPKQPYPAVFQVFPVTHLLAVKVSAVSNLDYGTVSEPTTFGSKVGEMLARIIR